MIRFFDILLSMIGLLVMFPVIFFFIIILSLTGERKIFFYQQRVGFKGKKFKLLKFATMRENSPHIGTKNITLLNDKRVLPVGKFLRKYKINEIMQLFNILKGDMTIVGPRPLTEDIFNMYDLKTKKILINTKPGLTGLSSVIFRDEEKIFSEKKYVKLYKKLVTPYKAKLETWFNKNNSIHFYFFCIFSTIFCVFFKKFNLLEYLYNIPAPNNKLKNIFKKMHKDKMVNE